MWAVGGELLGKAGEDSHLSGHLATTTHRCTPSVREHQARDALELLTPQPRLERYESRS